MGCFCQVAGEGYQNVDGRLPVGLTVRSRYNSVNWLHLKQYDSSWEEFMQQKLSKVPYFKLYSSSLWQQLSVVTAVLPHTGKSYSAWRSWSKHSGSTILGGKTAGTWSWLLTSIYCRGQQWLDVQTHVIPQVLMVWAGQTGLLKFLQTISTLQIIQTIWNYFIFNYIKWLRTVNT